MITKVEALNYKCLRDIEQGLGPFHVLVGPNASGKSTFLDVIGFMGDVVREGPVRAVSKRASNFRDLFWRGLGFRFELAIEARIPENLTALLENKSYGACRYEMSIGVQENYTEELGILGETLSLLKSTERAFRARTLFPQSRLPARDSLAYSGRKKSLVNKIYKGNDNFYSETGKWDHSFKLGPQKSALANLPEDEEKFPVSTWFKKILQEGIQILLLNSEAMRWACPPGTTRKFSPDGSNLPLVIESLKARNFPRYREWVAHIQTALPDVRDITVIERPEDKHKYIVVEHANGVRVPSWLTSDGTLRLLALTLLAYLPEMPGIYLIEEPENGIHPKAIQTIYQSLSSVYTGQVLLATHSPILLSITEPEHLLCFAKNEEGIVDVVSGTEHPYRREWQREISLGDVFASGILG
ncbi:MAG: ATP-binding protein [Candidatus Abyssubacteria bacterium]